MYSNLLVDSSFEEFLEGLWFGISFGFSSASAFALCVLFEVMRLAVALLVVGIILTVKKKKSGSVMLGVSISVIVVLVVGGAVFFLPKPSGKITFETPHGESKISEEKLEKFQRSLSFLDGEYAEEHLDKYPDLIYYVSNGSDPLNFATADGNVVVCEVLLQHGASYDNEFMLERLNEKYAFEHFFKYYLWNGSSKTVELVQLMLDNGAMVNYPDNNDNPNALFSAVEWAANDGMLNTEEAEIIRMLAESGADTTALNSEGKTPLELFNEFKEGYDIYEGDAAKSIENTLR